MLHGMSKYKRPWKSVLELGSAAYYDVDDFGDGTATGTRLAPIVFTGTWSSALLTHSFPYPPSVHLVGNDGKSYAVGHTHNDATHVAIQFPVPFSGKIILG